MMLRGRQVTTVISGLTVVFFAAEIRAWHGEEALWKVFWVYGVGTSGLIAGFYVAAVYTGHTALQQVLLPCFATYTVWILVSVWRCAHNAPQRFWGLMARFLTVAWACNTILVLTFLQLDLVTQYLGH